MSPGRQPAPEFTSEGTACRPFVVWTVRHNARMKRPVLQAVPILGLCWALAPAAALAQGTVYRCPGNPESYTNLYSAQEAKDKGCRTIDGAPITIVQGTARAPARPAASGAATPAPRPGESRIDPADQRARDTDARRILGEELRREEEKLAQLQKEFNNGEPERRGDERNYQRYLDRVAEMKAALARKEADIAALRRELNKLPP